MIRKFTVTVDGPDLAVESLRPSHIEDALSFGLKIPHDDVTAEEDPS